MTKLQATSDQVFGDTYANAVGALPGANEPWIDSMRQTSRALVGAQGFPGPKVEAWKYTSLNQVAKVPFIPATRADDVDVSSLPLGVPVIGNAFKVVFVNGIYRGDLSDSFDDLDGGVSLKPFADVLKTDPSALKGVLGSSAAVGQSFTTALNTGFMEQGVVLHVAKNIVLERPFHLISIGASGAEPGAFHPRFNLSLEQSSSATVIESHVGLPGQSYLSNPVTEILLKEEAVLRHYTNVGEDSDAFHLGRTSVTVGENAKYESFVLSLGGQLVRREIQVSLEGVSASAIVDGVYGLSDKQHSDITSEILHLAPHTTSNQVVKGVLGGESRGVFQGRVHVAREAQKTDGRQLHKALLLNLGPEVDCKPELEIYADDVQCAHGATTGEMDQNHIFYFLSRGIDEETARALLVEGFLDEVVLDIGEETVRKMVLGLVSSWLARQKIVAVSAS
jgi:Fe-S cluster assembly protein SufD